MQKKTDTKEVEMSNRKCDGPFPSEIPHPINFVFKLVGLTLIHKGSLLARCKLETNIGLRLSCNILQAKNEPDKIFVSPVGEYFNGDYIPLVEFATSELRDGFQRAAQAALKPYWSKIIAPPNQQRRAK